MPKRKIYQTTGTEPQYDTWYNFFRLKSVILSGTNTLEVNLSDLKGLQTEMDMLVGN